MGYELILDRLHQVTRLTSEAIGIDLPINVRELCIRRLIFGDPTLADHAIKYVFPSPFKFAIIWCLRVIAWRVNDCGQQCTLTEIELINGLTEITASGRINAVSIATEIDGVQIIFENLIF